MGSGTDRRAFLAGAGLALVAGCVPRHVRGDTDLIQKLDREVIALKQENARLREQVKSCDSDTLPPPVIYTELRQVFAGQEVGVARNKRQTIVTLPGATMFAPGSTRLRSESEMVMDLLSTGLNLHMKTAVLVIGHTDDTPIAGRLKRMYPSNLELSAARAASVVRALVGDWGVSPHRFTAAGRGEWRPIADNSTAEGREMNRRVEIVITDQEETP